MTEETMKNRVMMKIDKYIKKEERALELAPYSSVEIMPKTVKTKDASAMMSSYLLVLLKELRKEIEKL